MQLCEYMTYKKSNGERICKPLDKRCTLCILSDYRYYKEIIEKEEDNDIRKD